MDLLPLFQTAESLVSASKSVVFILSPAVFVLLFLVTAPWGRHEEGRSPWWGYRVPPAIAWLVQEAPNFVAVWFFLRGARAGQLINAFLLSLFLVHYVNRTFIYPFRARMARGTPLSVMSLAGLWTLFNGTVHGIWLGEYAVYDDNWATHPQFLIGVALWIIGCYINMQSDEILMNLREPGDHKYYIPRGGMFNYVTASNYFGEWIEWCGFALATNAWVSLAFAVFTFANLFPRGYASHLWYKQKFPRTYPKDRKVFIPFLI